MTLIVRTLRPIKSCNGKQVRSSEALRPTWEHPASALTAWMRHGQSSLQLATDLVAPASSTTGPIKLPPEVECLASWAAESSWALPGKYITTLLHKSAPELCLLCGWPSTHAPCHLAAQVSFVGCVAWASCPQHVALAAELQGTCLRQPGAPHTVFEAWADSGLSAEMEGDMSEDDIPKHVPRGARSARTGTGRKPRAGTDSGGGGGGTGDAAVALQLQREENVAGRPRRAAARQAAQNLKV